MSALGLLHPVDPKKITTLPQVAPERKHRKQCGRTWRRGKRGIVQARLTANPYKRAVPTIMLANVVWTAKWIL